MARRYSESSSDSWSLVERRSSVESSDEEEAELVTRDVYDEYDNESVGNDSMEDDTDFSGEDSELEDEEALEDAVVAQEEEQEEEMSQAEEEEEEDGEVETIHEEEALADSAARHFVAAEKVAERFDELADSYDSPMEEALFTAVATPERMRLFVVLWLAITGAIVLGLERAFVANMSLITPNGAASEMMVQAGLPSREHHYSSRIGVAGVREFLNRRQLLRTPPGYGAYQKAYADLVDERKGRRVSEGRCSGAYANVSISIRAPTYTWSQCTAADAPMAKPSAPVVHLIAHSPNKTMQSPFKTALITPRFVTMGTLVKPVQPKLQLPKPPCSLSSARPCISSSVLRPTKAPRTVRPTKTTPLKPTLKTSPLKPTLAAKATPVKYSTPKNLAVYRNYSVARVYQDRSLRRDPKPCLLPSKPFIVKKPVAEKKKQEAVGTCKNTVLDRMKKRREQQTATLKKMSKRSVPPPVIYANASTASKALMRKTSFAAGHCDRRTVKQLRPLPCISYKEQLPCLAPPPRRLITGESKKKAEKKKQENKIWANASSKKVAARSPKKEYIRRIPLV